MKSLGTRFLIPFALLALFMSIFIFRQSYELSRRHANELISQQAAMALEFNLAIRDYAAEHIRPAMEKLVDRDAFTPETMSTSFISRAIFEEVRKKFPNYVVRFSSENPRNPVNMATPDELRMIDYFRRNPRVERRSEGIQINGERYLAYFTPKWMKPECIRCHGDPKDAPAEMVDRYGATASFHRTVGDVAGLDTVAIPVEAINAPFVSEVRSQSIVLILALAFLFGAIFFVFRFVVTRRLVAMAGHFNEIAAHTESPWMTPVEVKGNDEISVLGVAFNKLLEQLRAIQASLEMRVSQRTNELRNANERLLSELAERKRAEEALKASQQQFADIIDFLPDATLVIDKEGKVIAWNRAMEEMTGIEATDMLGKGNYEYSLPFHGERRPMLIDLVLEPREDIEAKYTNLERKERVLVGEAYVPALGEGKAFVSATAGALRDNKGGIVGAIESIRDITERKKAEEALELTQFSVEHAADPIYWIGSEAQILYANEAACRSLGYTKDELLALSVPDIDPHFPAEKWPAFWQDILGKASVAFESTHRRRDGSTFPIEVNINNLAFVGKEFNLVFIKDISERRQAEIQRQALEAQLRQAQKMEAIGTLAGGIAHDFNNILAAIIGYTEMVVADLSQLNPMRHDLEQVLKAGYRARDLVKQILVFSRMKTGETRQGVDVGRVIEEVFKFLRASLPTTIEIHTRIESETGTTLGDPTQIHELLMNLCTNAAHAMEEEGGVLEVSLTDVELDANVMSVHPDTNPGPYLLLTVTDTGHGMDTETMEHIFEPYFTTKEVGKGTGFGLAVVHGIVKRHGGAVTVHSKPDKGTTFRVYLPSIAEASGGEDEGEGPVVGGTERILFVDDEEALTNMAKSMLHQLGYEVHAHTGSMEALRVFQGRPLDFDLVITDFTMPQMTGSDLAKEILNIRSDIPVILCTGFSERITEEKANGIGVREFLMKPFSRRGLAAVIRRVLEKK